jgi:hypothetical protein
VLTVDGQGEDESGRSANGLERTTAMSAQSTPLLHQILYGMITDF